MLITQTPESILDNNYAAFLQSFLQGQTCVSLSWLILTDILEEVDAVNIDVVNHSCKLRVIITKTH